jgi:hypothetical protein
MELLNTPSPSCLFRERITLRSRSRLRKRCAGVQVETEEIHISAEAVALPSSLKKAGEARPGFVGFVVGAPFHLR